MINVVSVNMILWDETMPTLNDLEDIDEINNKLENDY